MSHFAGSPEDTIESLRAVAAGGDPARPLLTWYNDATGERVELSGATLDNWVAKTANLLVDGCGLGPGAVAAVALPPHWQTAAVLLGCWAAGLAVAPDGSAPADVVFADAPVDSTAADRFLLGFAPMGLPLREVPPGWLDYVVEVRGHGDRFAPPVPVRPGDPATPSLSHAGLVARARARAAELELAGRVLVDAARYGDPVDWLLAPLAAGGSIVLCGQLAPGNLPARTAAERVDVTLA
jgi:uncharacterized protein (TIGR03089 family)